MRAPFLLTVLALISSELASQSLEQRLRAVPEGTVRMSFAARPGVCGSGSSNINLREASAEWESECNDRLVRVALELAGGRTVAVRTYVGGRWRPGRSATDLGTVRPQEAATYLLDLALRSDDLDGDPVLPATLADSVVVWPTLLRIARTDRLPEDRRRTAVFWLSQAAGEAATVVLDSIAADNRGDLEVRKQAVFALSQRSSNDAVPALIRIARTNSSPELRKTALFWLGQSHDPRAIDLFEEILR